MYAESEHYYDLSLHWIPLTQVAQPEFSQKHLTSFDFQVISLTAPKIIERVFNSQKAIGMGVSTELDQHQADYGVVICDDREYFKSLVEGLLYGNFMRNGNRWRFYKAYELDLPTMAEIQNFKALIVWSSTSTPSFKEN